jgi:hypothetical protein
VGVRTLRVMIFLGIVAMLGCLGLGRWYDSRAQEAQEIVLTLDKKFDEAYARLLKERTSVNDKAVAAVLEEREAARSVVDSLRSKSWNYREVGFVLVSLIVVITLTMDWIAKRRANHNAA